MTIILKINIGNGLHNWKTEHQAIIDYIGVGKWVEPVTPIEGNIIF